MLHPDGVEICGLVKVLQQYDEAQHFISVRWQIRLTYRGTELGRVLQVQRQRDILSEVACWIRELLVLIETAKLLAGVGRGQGNVDGICNFGADPGPQRIRVREIEIETAGVHRGK